MSGSCPTFPIRIAIAIMLCTAVALVVATRVGISIALVAMVNYTADDTSSNGSSFISQDDTCPSQTNDSISAWNPVGETFNWSRTMQGYILSMYFVGSLIIQIPAGTVAQMFGGKTSLIICISLLAIFNVVSPISASFSPYLLMAIIGLKGCASGAVLPISLAVLVCWAPDEEKSSLNAILMSGISVGQIIGQAISGPICVSELLGGWPSVFYFNSAFEIVWVIIWIFIASSTPDQHPWISEKEKKFITKDMSVTQIEVNNRSVPFRQMICSQVMPHLMLCGIMYGWTKFFSMLCFPQYINDVLHFSVDHNSELLSLISLAAFVATNVYGQLADIILRKEWLSKKIVRRLFNLIGFFGFGAASFFVTLGRCNTSAVIVTLFVGMILFEATTAGVMMIPIDASPEYVGTLIGIENSFATISGFAAPVIVDHMTATMSLQSWKYVWYLSAALMTVAGLLSIVFDTSKRYLWHQKDEEIPLQQVNKQTDHQH